jgi:hypothetical protein
LALNSTAAALFRRSEKPSEGGGRERHQAPLRVRSDQPAVALTDTQCGSTWNVAVKGCKWDALSYPPSPEGFRDEVQSPEIRRHGQHHRTSRFANDATHGEALPDTAVPAAPSKLIGPLRSSASTANSSSSIIHQRRRRLPS